MVQLEIKNILRRCGAAKLAEFIGGDRLESIVSITGDYVTESKMADIIIAKNGSQILANKKLRTLIIPTLQKTEIQFLLSYDSNKEIKSEDYIKLQSFTWAKDDELTNKWLDLFGLDESYLPQQKEKTESQDVISPDTILYPYQKRTKDRLVRLLMEGTNRILVHMPTGAGKTRATIEALVDYWRIQGDGNGYLVWLTDSEELCIQAEETFKKLWSVRGDRPINFIRLWGSHNIKKLKKDGGLIIASLQKLRSLKNSSSNDRFELINEIHLRTRLVVVDEAHKSIATTYKQIIEFLCDLDKTKLVGLTATPGRSIEKQISELVAFYGNNKITLTDEHGNDIEDPIKFLQDNNYLSTINRKKVPTNVVIDLTSNEIKNLSNFFEISVRVLLELSRDEQRNAIIFKEISDLHDKGRQTIVFACSVEHAHLISELLMIRGMPAKCVDSNTPSDDRKKYIEEFKNGKLKVLVNYGVLTTGFDAPNANAVVITRPTGSLVLYSQMIGRGIRGPKMGGTKDCILIDLEDNLEGYPSERQAFNFFNTHWR